MIFCVLMIAACGFDNQVVKESHVNNIIWWCKQADPTLGRCSVEDPTAPGA
jgi:hypothetical protein